jgi:hypothetical protein
MSYLGSVEMNDANIKHYSLTSSTLTTVDIGWVPPSEQSLRVTINGVVQQGGSFSLSGSNLTLGGPLVATDDLEVIGIQSVGNVITPIDNSVTTAKLADDSVTLAKMAGGTDGNLITYDASGDPAHVATGSATHVLTSNGAGAAPTFQAAAAGGMVLQVKETSSNSTISTSSTSYVTTGLTITTDAPASTSSRFILTLAGGTTYSDYAAGEVWTTFYVGGSEVAATGPYSMIQENDRYHITMVPNNFFTNSAMMIHSPASVSAQTYAVFFKANANGAYFNLASSRVVFTVMELSS